MSAQDYDYDDDDIDPETGEAVTQPRTPPTRAELREAGKAAKAQAAELARVQRELALTKAGIDTDTPLGKLFARSYEGETTVEAIKASWAELGQSDSTPTPDDAAAADDADGITPEERNSTQERNNLANGVSAAAEPDVDPRITAEAAGRKVVDDGGMELDGLATHFGLLVQAAKAGDKRVLVPGFSDQ